MKWQAAALLDYAASLKLDALLVSDLEALGSLDDAPLRELRSRAGDLGIALYVGGWSICPTSKSFRPTWGTAEEHLRLGLRLARTLGSPVYRVILGNREDRRSEGGIEARIRDTVAVLRACRTQALDTGVKVAVENHAGDMHSWELAQLIAEAGPEFVGANFDSGNAAWTLEDPLDAFANLARHIVCCSLRDTMMWQTTDGATVQWTAVGEGLVDWKVLAERWAEACPQVPIIVETISGGQRTFPYKLPEFWRSYDRRSAALTGFEAMAKRGHPIARFTAPAGPAGVAATQAFQKAELERSIAFLRERVGLGLKR